MICVDESLKVASKFNIPGIIPNWNASTWSYRWGQLIWMTFLDCRGLLWPGTASWSLHKYHSSYTEVLKILKLWYWVKILVDLCHINIYLLILWREIFPCWRDILRQITHFIWYQFILNILTPLYGSTQNWLFFSFFLLLNEDLELDVICYIFLSSLVCYAFLISQCHATKNWNWSPSMSRSVK